MTCELVGYFSDMSDAADRDLQLDRTLRRCTRCHRPSDVLVQDDRGLAVAACVDHLEWAFLTGLDEWMGRWRTA
jgi:hypothetical protein